jgi:hypothetical protein
MRNFILLTKFFASIPPEVLEQPGSHRVGRSGARESEPGAGLLQLLRRAGSENSRHAMAVTLDLLESVGKAL